MSNQEATHFNVQLYRQYPHVYNVVVCLVQEYNNALKTIEAMNKKGELEVEALFGRLCYGESQYFDNTLPVPVMNKLLTMLSSFGSWDSISDWYIVYDYYTPSSERIRISYENKVQKITSIKKESLSFKDCSYSQDKHPHVWELREYLIRVNMKYEVKSIEVAEMTEFNSIKISMRKYFVLRSSNLPAISFRFELIQFWIGETTTEAEQKMKNEEPKCTFECEIINLPQTNTLTDSEKSLLFTSLLLKMQDFIDIPFYTDLLHSKDGNIPIVSTFQLV
jgi:hypothetical protein